MELILKYFKSFTQKQIEQFSQLITIYNELNQKINLISRKDIQDLALKHILHSLAIVKFAENIAEKNKTVSIFANSSQITDIGTGGGFPGIPLAIAFPKVKFTLVDSIKKKTTAVKFITKQLNLTNITIINDRIENIPTQADYYVTRAVASMKTLISYIKNSPTKKGLIALKGGDLNAELQGLKNLQITDINLYFKEDFFEHKKIIFIPFK